MVDLTMNTLRQALLEIFFGKNWKSYAKYVIPIQGNWWTPSDKDNEKVSTWVGYSIISREPQLRTRVVQDYVGEELVDCFVTTCRAIVHLQIIGKEAEKMATSLIHWDERSDVNAILARFGGQLQYDKRKVITTLYYQDGQNSTLAYNVDFRFLFSDVVTPSVQIPLTGVTVGGTLIIPN